MLFHFDEVSHYAEHSVRLGVVRHLDNLVHLAETERFESIFLTLGFVYWAFDQFNFQTAHAFAFCKR